MIVLDEESFEDSSSNNTVIRLAEKKAEKAAPTEKTADNANKKSSPRPKWVDAPAEVATDRTGNTYRMTATIGPYTTRQECDAQLLATVRARSADYVASLLGSDASAVVNSLSDRYLREHVVRDTWEETVEVSVGPMVQLHTRLEYDDSVRRRIEELWHESQVAERLTLTAQIAGGVLAAVGAVYFYLRRMLTATPANAAA
jgi:hypothetical protein